MSTHEHEAAADVTDEELAAMGRVFTKFVPPGHFWPKLVAEIKRRRAEAIDADHEWAQWFEKWRATLDTFSSLRMMDAAALADTVRVARWNENLACARLIESQPWLSSEEAASAIRARVGDAAATAKPHVCTYQCADTDCEHVVGSGDATPGPEPEHSYSCKNAWLNGDEGPCICDVRNHRATPPKKRTE